MLKKIFGSLEVKKNEVVGIASSGKTDRHGHIIKQDGWMLSLFKRNPVFLASHNSFEFPIGKITKIAIEEGKLMFRAVFTEATQPAREARQLVKEGVLKTFSVGFIPREFDEKNSRIITKAELLEISLVALPANPDAVVIAKGLENDLAEEMIKSWLLDEKLKGEVDDLENKKVIPYSIHGDSEKAPLGTEWDAGIEVKKASIEQLKKMCTWFDTEKEDTKGAYKLPHHKTSGAVVWKGVTSAMAALMGARGGVALPGDDRKGVYNHLAKHYKQFDREAPEFKFVEEILNASKVREDKENGEEGKKVGNINPVVLKRAVSYMQELCRDIKKGGAKNG